VTFTLRPAEPADATSLAEFAERTFRDSFGSQNRPEDMDAYAALAFGAEQQSAELRDPRVACILAESEGRLIGYAIIRAVSSEVPASVTGPAPVELARLYVERGWQGRGVGESLMDAAIEAARARGGRTLWLGVWEHNPRARAFYARRGFREVGEHDFLLGPDRQRDLLLALDLV
jgi:ribosomal protein S18 acetylase RimI-like enzyme